MPCVTAALRCSGTKWGTGSSETLDSSTLKYGSEPKLRTAFSLTLPRRVPKLKAQGRAARGLAVVSAAFNAALPAALCYLRWVAALMSCILHLTNFWPVPLRCKVDILERE